jgi:ubiquinone/menaquinone biosynthesis C-methylase UbiE
MHPRDIFKSAAYYYARYKPLYPPDLIRQIAERFHLDGTGRLLDLGCGTGPLSILFSPYFTEVIGLDPEPGMLAEARRIADERNITNITWLEACAEDIGPHLGAFRLASLGSSFHWMQQGLVLELLYGMIEPGGGAVITDFNDGATSYTAADPRLTVKAIVTRYLGERRRMGTGFFDRQVEPYETCITRSRFRIGEPVRVVAEFTRTIDWLVGNCFAHSSSTPAVLGDKIAAFEHDLRTELLALNPSGEFAGTLAHHAFILHRD